MDDLPLYEEIIQLKKARIPAALAIVVETKGSVPRKAGAKMLVRMDGTISGTIGGGQTEADTIAAAQEVVRKGKPRTISFSLTEQHGAVCGGNIVVYLEPLSVTPHLVVIGAGHVGRAVADAARQAEFYVSLINLAENKSKTGLAEDVIPHSIHELPIAFEAIGVDANTYIFIATNDHQQDFLVASNALKTDACYIGVLGSTRKRAAMMKHLQNENFVDKELSRITSPAGLEICAETPAEIAISIVAQMILVRRSESAAHSSYSACSRAITEDGQLQTAVATG